MAEDIGLMVAHKPDSQEICFVPDNDYAKFIDETTGVRAKPGDFITAEGEVIGRHRGITHTIRSVSEKGSAFRWDVLYSSRRSDRRRTKW